MPVQGHPESKYLRPIESPLVGSYLTTFEYNIVSVIIFNIFIDVERSGTAQHQEMEN